MKGVKVTMYHNPNGRKETIVVHNVRPEDQQFFVANDYVVSMEHIGPGPTHMAVYGRPRDQDEETEIIVLSMGRSCEETFAELAKLCQSEFGAQQ